MPIADSFVGVSSPDRQAAAKTVKLHMDSANERLIESHFERLSNLAAEWRRAGSRPQSPPWIRVAATTIDRSVAVVRAWKMRSVREELPETISRLIEEGFSAPAPTVGDRVGGPRQATCYRLLAEFYVVAGAFSRALELATMALQESESVGMLPEAARCRHLLGTVHLRLGRWQEAEKLLEEARAYYDSLHDAVGSSDCLMDLGELNYRRGEYSQARSIYSTGLDAALACGQTAKIAQFHYHLGVLSRMERGDEETFGYLREALVRFESIRDLRGAADCLNNLGLLHLQRGFFREAGESFERALDLCRLSSSLPLMVFVHLNRALCYLRTADLESASASCSLALELILRQRDPVGLAKANRIWGRLYWEASLHTAAEIFYRESMLLYEKLGIPLGQANCYLEFGEMLCGLGELERGSTYLTSARDLYRLLNLELEAQRLDGAVQDVEVRRSRARRKRAVARAASLPQLME